MDGRPIAWDKHAYWIPNQFVEVNPLEYVEKRRKAIVSGLKFQQERLRRIKKVDSFDGLGRGGTHIVWTRSSTDLSIPDESIDTVITDPPYGSNVQYGELSQFWLVWLRGELGLPSSMSMRKEILVHRRLQTINSKDYTDYYNGLKDVFSECYRVLKRGGALAFTFNNKDVKAWSAVTRAVLDSGFSLDPKGVVYQDSVENYKGTSHTRYAGSLHGDFIYTFRKIDQEQLASDEGRVETGLSALTLEEKILSRARLYLSEAGTASTAELYSAVIPTLITEISSLNGQRGSSRLEPPLGDLDQIFKKHFIWNATTKRWREGR
jgi:hypothetical protein